MVGFEKTMVYVIDAIERSVTPPESNDSYGLIRAATLKGPAIKAKLFASGIDWMEASPWRSWHSGGRLTFVTDDEALVLMSYTGLQGSSTGPNPTATSTGEAKAAKQSLRLAIQFEVVDARYSWLGQSFFFAEGRLLDGGRQEYDVYRII